MNSESIRISHPDLIKIREVKSSGTCDLKEGKLLRYFETKSSPGISVLILEFEDISSLNQIRLHSNSQEIAFFPDTFRFDISMDGIVWEPILQETGFKHLNQKTGQWNFSLVQAKFLKLVSQVSEKDNSGKYKISLGQLEVGISGIVKIQVSSEQDRFWVKENLIDQRPDYGWSSKEVSKPGEEFFLIDLGSISRVNELRLLTPKLDPTFFPESFIIYYSEDDLSWNQLLEENQFLSEPGVWYQWRFLPTNVRYLKLVVRQKEKKGQESYQSKIVEVELYATPHLSDLTNKPTAEPLPYATVLRSGLVRLAVDGENSEGVAVQSNDRRLRDASTEYKGIVELAADGEDKEGVVIQGNDKRLKHATELTHGLIRLASNGENRAERAVQGNDDRLRAATISSLGIVELAENGETKEGVVVQGNDDRLKIATSKKYGLVILSEPGGSEPGRVVTADDPRIKKANTEFPGIVRFARNGEDSSEAAVQGNDKRLKIATTETCGIVQLAQSGESKEGLAVQGNDERLRKATTSYPGIVEIAALGTKASGKVVSADDPRLSDKRDPKPHTHDYASLNHDFSSHTGFLKVKGVTEAAYANISPPPENHSPIYGKNESEKGAGIIGAARNTGLIGYGEKFGVRGDSSSDDKDGAGIVGLAKRGFGGVFHSRSGVALLATGKGIPAFGEVGSGKAFLAEGESEFSGTVRISTEKNSDCIARVFSVNPADVISEGDILVMGEDGRLQKAKTNNATHTIGVAVKSAALLLGDHIPASGGKDHWLVAVSGVVTVNADASSYPIQPGSLLVTGLTGGHAVRISAESLRPGALFGKALTPLRSGRGQIQVLLCFQ
ncbi:discoidin domain-containing protein [Leptospira santarosai]|uniref:discoidin domain-containing protein n=1 Tax=Leptospira santarosai TaxID=28183 RepID=UPI0002BEDFC2|nr:discoidin domain-containing protein [Leptospira santarosai]EMJ46485.1 F5/8 type C domain protein [Leptospira santarosai str. HAI1349]EMO20929.1 F5/8 type C domain protein [Leptospira santarosai str. HAI134]EMP81623.1 F5/8 type C domain protein [Leptospira santarosai str. CBC1531]